MLRIPAPCRKMTTIKITVPTKISNTGFGFDRWSNRYVLGLVTPGGGLFANLPPDRKLQACSFALVLVAGRIGLISACRRRVIAAILCDCRSDCGVRDDARTV